MTAFLPLELVLYKKDNEGGNNMAAILMIDDEQAILELVKNGLQKDRHL